MTVKCVYHKSDDYGSFSGDYFHADKEYLNISDEIYVISSKKQFNGNHKTPYLEGLFKVITKIPGDEHFLNGKQFRYKWTITPIIKPKEPIDISSLRDEWDKCEKANYFKNKFLNIVKSKPSSHETEAFNNILKKHTTVLSYQPIEDALLQDLCEITQSDTERSQEILARIGQGRFRQNVASVWKLEQEMCVLTGIVLPVILTASHIVPWSECTGKNAVNRWDGANGILLCANIDRLFDQYFLSFRRKTSSCIIEYSQSLLKKSDYMKQLGLSSDLKLVPNKMAASDKERFFNYMAMHYETFLAKEKDRNKNKILQF